MSNMPNSYFYIFSAWCDPLSYQAEKTTIWKKLSKP